MPTEEQITCGLCGTKMEKAVQFPSRTLDTYAGSASVTHTSSTGTLTFHPIPDSEDTSVTLHGPVQPRNTPRRAIVITTYVCPKCKWTKQLLE